MAGRTQTAAPSKQERNIQDRQQAGTLPDIKKLKKEEIEQAIYQYGLKNIIQAYRESGTEPPADVLLSYFYQDPVDVVKNGGNESVLLQKAYGEKFIKDIYIERVGSSDGFQSLSGWQKVKGWFGRLFGSYKTVGKWENHTFQDAEPMRPTGAESENEDFKEQPKPDMEEEVRSEIPEETKEKGSMPPPDMGKIMERAALDEKTEQEQPQQEEQTAETQELAQRAEQGKVYRGYIHLPEYEEIAYDFKNTSYLAKEVILGLGADQSFLFPLQTSDFTLIHTGKTNHTFAKMTTGSGGILSNGIYLGVSGMKYDDLSDEFLPQTAEIGIAGILKKYPVSNLALNRHQVSASEIKKEVTVADSTFSLSAEQIGYDFDAKSPFWENMSVLGKLSLGGTVLNAELSEFTYQSNTLSAGEFSGSAAFDNRQITLEGKGITYHPENGMDFESLTGKTGSIKVFDGFELSDPTVTVTKNAGKYGAVISAGLEVSIGSDCLNFSTESVEVSIEDGTLSDFTMENTKISLLGGKLNSEAASFLYSKAKSEITASDLSVSDGEKRFELSVGSLTYNQEGFAFSGAKGNTEFSIGGKGVTLSLEDAEYDGTGIKIGSMTGTLKIQDNNFELTGTGISYTGADGIDFESLTGKAGSIKIFDGFELSEPTVTVTKNTGTYDAKISAGLEVSIGSDRLNFSTESVEVSIEDGSLSDFTMENAKLSFCGGKLNSEMASFLYSKAKSEITASNLSVSDGEKKFELSVESLTYNQEGFAFSGAKGNTEFSIGGKEVTLSLEDAEYDGTEIKIGSMTGTLEIQDSNFELTGTGISYTGADGIDFESISGVYNGEITVFDGFKFLNPGIAVTKDSEDCKVMISAGLDIQKAGVIHLNSEQVSLSWDEEAGFGGVDIESVNVDIKNGLIHTTADTIHIVPSENKKLAVSTEKLEITFGEKNKEEAEDIPSLKNTWEFLDVENIGAEVTDIVYDEKGLSFGQFSFTKGKITIGDKEKIGAEIDFANNSLAGFFQWSYNYADGQAEKLIGFDFDYMLFPGISAGVGFGAGAGFKVDTIAEMQRMKARQYKFTGSLSFAGNAWAAADIHAKLGAAGVGFLKAAIEAKAPVELSASMKLSSEFFYDQEKKKFSLKEAGTSFNYEAAGLAKLNLAAKVSGKFLVFKEKTLYEKKLGEWTLGEFNIQGSWDGEDEKKVEDKNKFPTAEELQKTEIEQIDGGAGVPIPEITPERNENGVETLLKLQEKRESAEEILMDTNTAWGISGGEASKSVIRQIQDLSEIYDEILDSMQLKADELEFQRDQRLDEISLLLSDKAARNSIYQGIKKRVKPNQELREDLKTKNAAQTMRNEYKLEYKKAYYMVLKSELHQVTGLTEEWCRKNDDVVNAEKIRMIWNEIPNTIPGKITLNEIEKNIDISVKAWRQIQKLKIWAKAVEELHFQKRSEVIHTIVEKRLHSDASNMERFANQKIAETDAMEKERRGEQTKLNQEEKGMIFSEAMLLYSNNAKDFYANKVEFNRKAFDQATAVLIEALDEQGELRGLNLRMKEFLAKSVEGLQTSQSEFGAICSEIKKYKIRENLKKMKQSADECEEMLKK